MLMMGVTLKLLKLRMTWRVATNPALQRRAFDAVLGMARSATRLEHALESQLIMTQWTNAQQLERGYAPKMNCLVKFAVEPGETVTHMWFGLLQCKVICHRVGESESLGGTTK